MEEAAQRQINHVTLRSGRAVLYVMSRDQRVRDNRALLSAQKHALKSKVPLVVMFVLRTHVGARSYEHAVFMCEGLKQVEAALDERAIHFVIRVGEPSTQVVALAEELGAEAIYLDFSPTKGARSIRKAIAERSSVPCYEVDAHNIVPLWIASDKKEFAAHTFRRKIHRHSREWLKEPEQILPHPYSLAQKPSGLTWREVKKSIEAYPRNGVRFSLRPGETAARQVLSEFLKGPLERYAFDKNDPNKQVLSRMSTYLHFGHIASLRIAIEVVARMQEEPLLFREAKIPSLGVGSTRDDSADTYLEELIVRKELADNFCYYSDDYTSLSAAWPWARSTLASHQADAREHIYTVEELESANTHDEAWNAAQRQMTRTGLMHGYMRMYWAKKILEWTESAQQAINIAIYLNDKYSFDGGDPNGYAGIMWSIAGVHDRPWFERPVYGAIRYMNASGLRRKFDVAEYVHDIS